MSFNIYEIVRAACQSRLGTFRYNDSTATGTLLHVLSVLSVIIPTYLLGQMYANPPEFELQVTILEFRKRNIMSSLPVTFSMKHESRYFHVVVAHTRQRKVQKSVMHPVQSCCFAY